MRVNIDCTLILLLLSGMLALLKIGGQFPYPWIWVLAPIWIPLLALAGITIILLTSSPRLKPGDSLVSRQGFPEGTCSPPTEVSLRRFEGPRRRVPPVRRIGCFWRR